MPSEMGSARCDARRFVERRRVLLGPRKSLRPRANSLYDYVQLIRTFLNGLLSVIEAETCRRGNVHMDISCLLYTSDAADE